MSLFTLFVVAMSAYADVIVDNLDQTTDGYYGPIGTDSNTNDFLIGQEFTLSAGNPAYTLDQITLLLNPINGNGNISVSVYSAGPDNNPTNPIAFVASQSVTNLGNVDFVPSTPIILSPGVYYAVTTPTTAADNSLVSWAYTSSTNWTGTATLGGFADTIPGSWENSPITAGPQQLSVQATPTLATLQIGFNGATVLSWPSGLSGYVAESTTNLVSPNWQTITNAPTLVAGNDTITNIWSDEARFFRLRQSSVVDNLDEPGSGNFGPIGTDSNDNDFLIGQEFTLPGGNSSYTLNKITLLLNPANGNGNISVSVYSVGPDNNPTNPIVFVASQSVTNFGNVDFVPSTTITLQPGNYYVVAAPTTSADNALVSWNYTSFIIWTGFGTLGSYADTIPGSWENSPIASGPQQMSVEATPASP